MRDFSSFFFSKGAFCALRGEKKDSKERMGKGKRKEEKSGRGKKKKKEEEKKRERRPSKGARARRQDAHRRRARKPNGTKGRAFLRPRGRDRSRFPLPLSAPATVSPFVVFFHFLEISGPFFLFLGLKNESERNKAALARSRHVDASKRLIAKVSHCVCRTHRAFRFFFRVLIAFFTRRIL